MMKIEEVADKTYSVAVQIPRVATPFTVYLICEEEGVLIEPGPTATIPWIQEAMKRLGMADPAYIIPTHIHMDHAGAVGNLVRLFPRARVLLHPRGAKHVVNPSRLIESTKMVFGNDFEDFFGTLLPVPESQVKTPGDGEVISITGRELQVIHTPGHAPHHLSIFDQRTKGLFSGEALGIPVPGAEFSPVPAAAPPSFDIE
ncbi:MAG: MBL fold metallo-hydrolase, partial [Desulfobacterales bacterium]|nr:MBL fold metallo-hydrolase [Desulfobacterales bacterium]